MAKSYWKKEYDEKRKSDIKIICARVSEDEAMWIFGEASNQGISVSQYIKNKILSDYNLLEDKNE